MRRMSCRWVCYILLMTMCLYTYIGADEANLISTDEICGLYVTSGIQAVPLSDLTPDICTTQMLSTQNGRLLCKQIVQTVSDRCRRCMGVLGDYKGLLINAGKWVYLLTSIMLICRHLYTKEKQLIAYLHRTDGKKRLPSQSM